MFVPGISAARYTVCRVPSVRGEPLRVSGNAWIPGKDPDARRPESGERLGNLRQPEGDVIDD